MSDPGTEFENLYRGTRLDVLRYLLRRTADAEDAADLLAEVYVVAWRRRSERPVGDEARAWLFGVARRVLADHTRRAVKRRAAADGLRALLRSVPDVLPPEPEPDPTVHEALFSLNEIDRELVTLTIWDGLSTTEAAQAIGLTPGAARVRLHRARARLRNLPLLR